MHGIKNFLLHDCWRRNLTSCIALSVSLYNFNTKRGIFDNLFLHDPSRILPHAIMPLAQPTHYPYKVWRIRRPWMNVDLVSREPFLDYFFY